MAAACENEEPLTCNEKEALEAEITQKVFEKLCSEANISDLLQLLLKPSWASDQDDWQAALLHNLTRVEICNPTNHAGTDCDPENPCIDPNPTYCPDDDVCASKFRGYGLLEIILAARRADSMVRLPVRDLDLIENGEPLVWDATLAPDNPDCDPCTANVLGAFTPQHIYEELHP